MTYTLTIDASIFPSLSGNIVTMGTCSDDAGTLLNIDELVGFLEATYSGTVTFVDNGDGTVTLTWDYDGGRCGDPIAVTVDGTSFGWQSCPDCPPPTPPCPEPTDLCPNCLDATYHWCTDELGIELGIPDGTYTVTITDHGSGVDYSQTVVSAGGVVTIDQTNLGGVFTPFSVYTMTVVDADGPVSWAVGYTEYTCLRFTFTKTVNT